MRRRRLSVLIVIGLFLALVASAHHLFVDRLIVQTALPSPWREIGTAFIVLCGVLIFANPIGERLLGPGAGRVLGWPAYLWLGTAFYLVLALWTSDALMVVLGAQGLEAARARAMAVCALVLAAVGVGAWSALRTPAVKRVELAIDGWPQTLTGYRIVQISDVHVGALIRRGFVQRIVERCNALQPDLIAITGDLVDGSVQHYAEEAAPFAQLRAREGVYFVTGNHDHYSGAERWIRKLEELGIIVLRNRRVVLGGERGRVELGGVDDVSSRRLDATGGYDMRAALAGWDGSTPLVLLSHHPSTFDEAVSHGVHLQLSGHTHGGQLWPFNAMVRLQTRYVAGVYRRGRSQLYVSRGTGFWGPPIRVFAPAEITELVLRTASDTPQSMRL
jgi:predicted MPP superfamily phosphohydrolase